MSFQSYGQNETLISSIRNIIKDYNFESIFKEFLQNADDAGASRFHVIVDCRFHPSNTLLCEEMKDWQGPAILIYNNAKFKEADFDSLMQIRVGGKQGDDTKIGKHGLGFNSCYHFTDVPSFISGDHIAFLDPQEKFLRNNGEPQRGIKGSIPKNGIRRYQKKDQLVPFDGIEGINFRSTFEGTLFRIPLRQKPSDISDSVFNTARIFQLIANIKSNITSQFLFLRNIEKMQMSYIPDTVPLKIMPLWEASITGLVENVRNQRKCITNDEIQTFQMEIELSYSGNIQKDHWIITTGAQQNPDDDELDRYARRHRLRVLGGVAALLSSSKEENQGNFSGIMYSFLSLSDTTHLPVHLNGTWAQGSDRGKLLIEDDDLPDLDHQKLDWNRHILLEFLPELYCKFLEKVIKLYESGEIDDLDEHPIVKFWPFPSSTQNYPKYAIEYGFKVLQLILESDEIFRLINNNIISSRVDVLFSYFRRERILGLRDLLRNNWDELEVDSDPDLKSMIRSLPIWPTLANPLEQDATPPLKSAACGHILPKRCHHYRTKNTKIYLNPVDDLTRRIFIELNVPVREFHSYVIEDVEFPRECDDHYIHFLKNVLEYNDSRIIQSLRNKRCFPTFTKHLKKIGDLYDYNNIVFRTVFNENSEVFLHHDFSKFTRRLSPIGFKDKINQATFLKCAEKIEELQKQPNPPNDLRYRGFILVDHFYKHIDVLELDSINRIPFVPISKKLDKPYSLSYNRPQVLDCFKNIIHHSHKEVAWSQMSLIAEDVIPPPLILQVHPLLCKPNVLTVINHLRYMYNDLRNDEEWTRDWAETFKHNVYEVYKWLDEECSDDEDLNLTEHFRSGERLFLNFNENQDPFNLGNWVSAEDLVLNSEVDDEKYVNPSLAEYATMLKSAGVREIIRPNVIINIREHDQPNINKSTTLDFLKDQEFPLNDVTFSVSGEEIRANRYMLATSCEYFRQKFTSGRFSEPVPVRDVEPNSMRVTLYYLYGQNIDEAIQSLNEEDEDDDDDSDVIMYDQPSNFDLYKDLLMLANDFNLGHLKDLMEFRLSRLVTRSNVDSIQGFAITSNAEQLRNYCNCYINDNSGLWT